MTVSPIHGENGKVICYVSLNQEVTDAFALQEALQKPHNEREARVAARTSQLSQRTSRLMTAQDRLAKCIARELQETIRVSIPVMARALSSVSAAG